MIDFAAHLGANSTLKESALREQMEAAAALLEDAKCGEPEYAADQGWLDPQQWAGREAIGRIEAVAARIRADADAFVVVGVGGSLNASRAVIEALQENGPEIFTMGNTLSPHALQKTLRALEGKRFYINCIAKNFETLEPGLSFRLLWAALKRQHGAQAGNYVVVTGTPGSALEELSHSRGCTFLPFPPDIGGRYTALSNVGLLPMAVAGVDIRAVVQGGCEMRAELLRQGAAENLALRYACVRNHLYWQGYQIELLASFEPQYRYFFKWWIQLFAESEGKQSKGLFPVAAEYSEELHALGQYVQEGTQLLFETFLKVREPSGALQVPVADAQDGFDYAGGKDFSAVNRAAQQATLQAHSSRLPCLTLEVPRIDAHSFGELFYFFQFACYLSGRLLGVNPFNQPGVEAYKQSMFRALGKPAQQPEIAPIQEAKP